MQRKGLQSLLILCFMALPAWLNAHDGGPVFSENQGQWDGPFHYKTALPGGFLFIEDGALTYLFYEEKTLKYFHPGDGDFEEGPFKFHSYRVRAVNAQSAQVTGKKAMPYYENYFLGNDPSKWKSRVPVYSQVSQSGIYDGIEMLVYNKQGALKYDFRVDPGADPHQIMLLFEGVDDLVLVDDELHIQTSVNKIIEKAPLAYQLIDGNFVEVECSYFLDGRTLSFDLGDYNPEYELVIDPELSFASYSGSAANNFGFTATDDNSENLYSGSIAYNAGYPTTIGAFDMNYNTSSDNVIDVALSKFSQDGSALEFSTYLGGNGQEMPHSIVVNNQDELIVMGNTGSVDFPTTANAYNNNFNGGTPFSFIDVSFGSMLHQDGCDLYIAKFSADGASLLGSTFVGGSGNDGLNIGQILNFNYGDVFRGEVIVDDEDNVIVASVTESEDFPVEDNAAQANFGGGGTDAVVFKLSANLDELLWSSFFGGQSDDSAYSVQLDSNGNVFIAGGTKSTMAPAATSPQGFYGGFSDGFLTRFSPDVQQIEGFTYIGGVSYEQCYFVQLDQNDMVYVIGQSKGSMPVSDGKYANPGGKQFIQKYNNLISNLEWSTVFGSGGTDIDISPCAFLVSDCDHIYVSGWGGVTNNAHSAFIDQSTTIGLPVSEDAFQPETDGSDFYLMVLGPEAEELIYATFFGGGLSNEHVDGGTSKFDKNGSVYQAVCAGCGGNDDFPVTPGVWSEQNGSSCNLGVFKFDLAKITAEIDLNGPDVICEGQPMQFENLSSGGENFIWFFGDGESSATNSPIHTYEAPGLYEVMLMVTDDNDCVQPDSTYVTIEVLSGVNPEVLPFDPICEGDSLTISGSGTVNAYWSEQPGLISIEEYDALVHPEPGLTTFYFVDFNDCETDSVPAEIQFYDTNFSVSENTSMCIGESAELEAAGGGAYMWSPVSGLSSTLTENPTASPDSSTTYFVDIISPEGCEFRDSVFVEVINDSPGGEMLDPVFTCVGEPAQLEIDEGSSWSWFPEAPLSNPNAQNPTALVAENTLFTVEIFNACGEGSSQVWVEISQPEAISGPDAEICLGEEIQIWAEGGATYNWYPGYGMTDSTLQSPTVSPPLSTEYHVIVTDEVGCSDTSAVQVTVYPLPEVEAGDYLETIWYQPVQLNGSAEGQYFWEPKEYVDCYDCAATPALPPDDMWFVLQSMNEYGCVNRDSTFIELLGPLFVPNSFSPNGDGVNDVFQPISIGLKSYHLQIYNRWGELIFETDDLGKPWVGGFKNQLCPPDVYIWKIKYTDPLRGDQIKMGHVTLIR